MIEAGISDLFFNLDFDDCKIMHKGVFARFDDDKVKERATWFCTTLARSTGAQVDPAALVRDFYGRV